MKATLNDTFIHYETIGKGQPIMLLHGNGESHEIFTPTAENLSKDHLVILPDSRCHGRSGETEELSYSLMADDMIALIRHLHLEKPIFYGYSDGGIVGLLMAIREPDLLSKLIVSGANIDPDGLDDEAIGEIREEAEGGRRLSQLMLDEPHIPLSDLNAIKTPTVLLAGEYDLIRPEHTALIHENIPGSVLDVIPGEDHGSYICFTEKLACILRKHI